MMNCINFNFLDEYLSSDRLYGLCDCRIESGYNIIYNNGIEVKRTEFKEKIGLENLKLRNCVIFCKLDYINELFNEVKKSKFEHILITSNCDFSLNKQRYDLKPDNIKIWIGTNFNILEKEFVPMPLGSQRIRGGGLAFDMLAINNQIKKQKHIKNFIYMNHNINTNVNKRGILTDYFKTKSFVTYKQNVSFKEYLDDVHSHLFVLAHEGNGIDCHRPWEAIYLNTIPIVQRSVLTEYFSNFLPMLIMDNFEDITEDYLIAKHKEITQKEYSFDLLKFSYWKNLIEKIRNGL